MAVNVSNTTTTNTFEYWRLRTNQMANLFREKAVTTNSNTAPGSASVTGTLSGSNLKANGTTQSTSITTGSLQSKGGLGVSRNAHIGGKLVVTGISNTANLNVAGTATATLFSGSGASLTSVDAETLDGKDSTDFVSNTFVVATFTTNNYIQSDTFKTDLGVVSNNYVQGRYTSNNFAKSTFTSNNYVKERFTSNNYVQSRFVSNNYVSTKVGLRATNTYVKSTFTSNNYVQNRFGSNNYIKNTFVSNSFVTDSFLRSDTTDTVTGVLTFSAETKFTSIANAATGNISLPNTANISIAGMDSNSNRYIRVNGDGTSLVFSDSSIANTGDIGDIQINYGSISNADVLVYDENTQKFVNRPRSLIDVTSVDDIDDVNIVKSKGDLLVRVVNTTDGTTFAGTSNGFITGRLDSMNETELTGLTANAVSFTSTSNSFVQVFVNGVRLGNADFVTTTSQVKLIDELVATDVISIVEFNPHAFSVGDGTPSDLNQLNYSDLRLKTSIEPYTASSTILDVETYTYQWKDTVRFNNRTEIGFIAQDLEKYVPELVVENETGEKMVDYGKMTTVLLSTIKQLNKRVEALESKTFCTCPEE
jgi:hypothetical protein